MSDTTDLYVERCPECGGIDFESSSTRRFCENCGLVVQRIFSCTGSTEILNDEN